MTPLRIGIAGLGKIARDQHLPAIAGCDAVALVATADPAGGLPDVPEFTSLEVMLDGAEIDAVSLCTPPQVRCRLARQALAAGKHVLLEKPPGATVSEVIDLAAFAERQGLTLFATWHSRFAAAVEPARTWLEGRTVRSVEITWREDVKRWHPGQAWIWEPGGLGVFDPGINALSIATRILDPFFLVSSHLSVPENCAAPIAADLAFTDAKGTPITADFDFRQEGPQTWDIAIATDGGRLVLSKGGAEMHVDGVAKVEAPDSEYAAIYARFAALVEAGTSDVDLAPFRHVADAFLMARFETVAPFHDDTPEALAR
ncbi:Gfo/Idh/MocA family protein [Amorphus sp. MBR-141]